MAVYKYDVIVKTLTFPLYIYSDNEDEAFDTALYQANNILERLPLSLKSQAEYEYRFELDYDWSYEESWKE